MIMLFMDGMKAWSILLVVVSVLLAQFRDVSVVLILINEISTFSSCSVMSVIV